MKLVPAEFLDRVILEDCIQGMKGLPDGSVDLVIADPPYNLEKDFGAWKEKERKSEWLPWSKKWLDECNRVLAESGSIFVYGIHHHLCWLQCYMYANQIGVPAANNLAL